MIRHRAHALLLPILLIVVTGAAANERCAGDPAQAAMAFYRHLVAHPQTDSGLPPEQAMPALSPWLTERMRRDIEAAREVRQRYMRAHPQDKPPFIEGSLFGSLFEGISAVEAAQPDSGATEDRANVTLRLRYDPPDYLKDSVPASWEDRAWMRCEQGQWRVDDVEYLGDWGFGPGHGTRLRDRFQEFLAP